MGKNNPGFEIISDEEVEAIRDKINSSEIDPYLFSILGDILDMLKELRNGTTTN